MGYALHFPLEKLRPKRPKKFLSPEAGSAWIHGCLTPLLRAVTLELGGKDGIKASHREQEVGAVGEECLHTQWERDASENQSSVNSVVPCKRRAEARGAQATQAPALGGHLLRCGAACQCTPQWSPVHTSSHASFLLT